MRAAICGERTFKSYSKTRLLTQEGGDEVGGAFDGPGRAEMRANFRESPAHFLGGGRGAKQAKSLLRDPPGSEIVLNQFGNNPSAGDEIHHAGEGRADQGHDEIRADGRNTVDNNHGHVQ